MKIMLSLILLAPLLPKLSLANGIFISPIDILLLVFILSKYRYLINACRFTHAAFILLPVFSLLGATYTSFNASIIPDFLRGIKWILYASTFYIGYYYRNHKSMREYIIRKMIMYGCFLAVYSILYLIIYGYGGIWDPTLLISGFSNIAFDLVNLQFISTGAGANNVFGVFFVFMILIIGNREFYLIKIFLFIAAIAITISREAFLCLILLLVNYTFIKKSYIYLLLLMICAVFVLQDINVQIPILDKLMFFITNSDLELSGGSLYQRYKSIELFLIFIYENPMYLIFGMGWGNDAHIYFINKIASFYSYKNYAAIPENSYQMFLSYAGIFGLTSVLIFFHYCYKSCHHNINNINILFFIIMVSSMGGSAFFSDYLFIYLMIYLGVNIRDNFVSSYGKG
jgi:hypothetical protein